MPATREALLQDIADELDTMRERLDQLRPEEVAAFVARARHLTNAAIELHDARPVIQSEPAERARRASPQSLPLG